MFPEHRYFNEKPVEPGKLRKGVDLSQHAIFLKLDGIHVIVHGGEAWSRTGELLPSLAHDVAVLMDNGTFLETEVYFCEAWSPDIPFPEISGHVRRKSQMVPDNLHLYPLDCVTVAEWHAGESQRPWITRVGRLANWMADEFGHGLHPLFPHPADKDLETLARQYVRKADLPGPIDGLILRDTHAGWAVGPATTGNVVKVKLRPSYSLVVDGYTAGKGKHLGKIGALIVRTGKDKTCEVGTGLSDADREGDPTRWIGQIVEVTCLGVNKSGKLREPAIVGTRTDTDCEFPADEVDE